MAEGKQGRQTIPCTESKKCKFAMAKRIQEREEYPTGQQARSTKQWQKNEVEDGTGSALCTLSCNNSVTRTTTVWSTSYGGIGLKILVVQVHRTTSGDRANRREIQ